MRLTKFIHLTSAHHPPAFLLFVFMCTYICVHVCGGQRSTACVFLNLFLPYFLRQCLSLSQRVCQGSETQGSSNLCLSGAGTTGACCHMQLFLWVLVMDSGPCTCEASTLLSEPSPLSPEPCSCKCIELRQLYPSRAHREKC